jgi:hypothetical protein
MSKNYKQDVLTGGGLFIFSLVLIFYLIPVYVGGSTHTQLSPQFFPTVAAWALAVLSLSLTAVSVKGLMAEKGKETIKTRLIPKFTFNPKSGPVLSAGIICAYFLGFEYVSFLAATPVAMILFMLAFGQRSWLRIVCISIAVTAAIYLLFTFGLKVPLE